MPIRQGRQSLLSKHIPSASVTNILRIRRPLAGTTVSGVARGAAALVLLGLATWFLMRCK
jgi:hypothetical protein